MIGRGWRCVIVAVGALAASIAYAEGSAGNWRSETLEVFGRMAVQDSGRVKPLDTYARFELLQLSGKRTYTFEKGDEKYRMSALEWLLDCLFYPETAKTYKVFLIESGEVMEALSIPHEKMRDRFSYNDLAPGRQQLFTLAQQYQGIENEKRTPAQKQFINLAHNVHDFEMLTLYFNFGRHDFDVTKSEVLQKVFPEKQTVMFSDVLAHAPQLMHAAMAVQGEDGTADPKALEDMSTFLQAVDHAAGTASSLAFIPGPGTVKEEPEWLSPAEMVQVVFEHPQESLDAQLAIVRGLESLEQTKSQPLQFQSAASTVQKAIADAAGARGEYDKVSLEVAYYKSNLFFWSLFLYIVAFLLAAISWARPRNKILWALPLGLLTVPLVLHTIGITMRCIIRDRPPVTTLYETIVFISAVAVLVALVMEFMNRQKIALSLGAFLGALGLFLANKYEAIEGVDTMPSLIAVLDTNFWLSTHVTTVTIGYAAGILAGAIAHIYLIGKALGLKKGDTQFYRSVTRMTYGVLCFGLLFSTLGTVLGGIWANDSWGRFWGWDPKENGALMIVLFELAILHFRMGGYIRDFGVNMMAVFGGVIVAFSWFGVNLLGVGLHAYGFTSGVAQALTIFYMVECAVLFIGTFAWLREQGYVRSSREASPTASANSQPQVTK